MEGYLYKWTNYVSRWQQRWFILDSEKGTLSYFENSDESTIIAGCRGSWRVCDCDLVVNADAESFQLVSVGGAQWVYLRASSTQERALWLKAIAHTKMVRNQAELNATASPTEDMPAERLGSVPSHQAGHTPLSLVVSSPSPSAAVSPSSLQKSGGSTSSASGHKVRPSKHDDALTYLRRLAASNASGTLRPDTAALRTRLDTLAAILDGARRDQGDLDPGNVAFQFTQETRERFVAACDSCQAALRVCLADAQLAESSQMRSSGILAGTDGEDDRSVRSRRVRNKSDSSTVSGHSTRSRKRVCDTPFISLESTFSSILLRQSSVDGESERNALRREPDSVSLNESALARGHEVDVDALLSACREVTLVFDYLNAAAFAPVKMDMLGNVRKVQACKATFASSARVATPITLRQLLLHEVAQHSCEQDESATVGTLWLIRALEFIIEFLRELLINTTVPRSDDGDLTAPVNDAETIEEVGGASLCEIAEHVYHKTLARYHDWVVRGMFKLAVRTLPSKAQFVHQLLVGLPRSRKTTATLGRVSARHVQQLLCDMDDYLAILDAVISEMRAAYADCGLSHLFNEPLAQPVALTS